MVYTRSSNQTASLPNQTACVQPTKQKSMHALSLARVSQARGYRPGLTYASNQTGPKRPDGCDDGQQVA